MHISKMKNGRWRVIVQDEGRRRSRVATTEREAKRAGAQLMIELGKEPDRTGATVDDLLDLHIAQSELARTTAKDYEYLIAKLPGWLLEWRVENVTTMMIDQAYRRLADDGWTVHRVRRLHEILRPAFDRAARWGWIAASPVVSAVPPRKPETDIDVPDVAHVQRLINQAERHSPELGAAILLTSRTGIRRGELCALQWDDFDETAGTINIRRSVSTTAGDAHHERKGKTGRAGHRVIPVGPAVVTALRSHRARNAQKALERGHPLSRWMFTHDGAHPWRTDYVTLALSRIVEDHDDIDIHIHQLRHFAATRWIAAGMDIRTVSYLLGHARTSTTLDIYTAYLPTRGQEAADVMERLFADGGA